MKVHVFVQPRSSQNKVVELAPDQFKVYTTSPPVGGAATTSVLRLLAKHFKVPAQAITLVYGKTTREKVVSIESNEI